MLLPAVESPDSRVRGGRRLGRAGSMFQLQVEAFPASQCWRTRIPDIPGGKLVTSTAKFAGTAKLVRRSARTGALE